MQLNYNLVANYILPQGSNTHSISPFEYTDLDALLRESVRYAEITPGVVYAACCEL